MRQERPAVLHLLAPAAFGGLETVVRQLARGQAEAGAQADIAAVHAGVGEPPFVAAARGDGVDVHVLRVPPRGYLRERREVGSLLERLRPTVLHTHGYRPDVIDSPVARSRGIATVSTAHGFVGNTARGRFYEWMQRRAFRRMDAVIAVSEPLRDTLVGSGVPEGRVHHVPNALRAGEHRLTRERARDQLDLPREGPPVVGFVGRIGPEKGLDVAIRALAEPALSGALLCVVGSGSAEDECRSLAEGLGVLGRITWTGTVPDAGALMAAFDVLALPSRTEGTPMVVLEADAAGVPVVATRVGGVPAVLGEGWNLVPPENPSALASAIGLALTDRGAVAEARARTRSRIERDYSPSAWVERHLDVYAAITGRSSTTAPAPGGAS